MGLAVLAVIHRPIMKPIVPLILIYFLYRIITGQDKQKEILIACAYIVGAEVFFRVTRSAFAYELGKYSVVLFSLMGLYYKGLNRNATPYILYFLLLMPAIAVSYEQLTFDINFRHSIAFNLSGPFCLTVASVFAFDRKVKFKDLMRMVDYMIYPLIALTVYVVLYSPSVKEAVYNTASNANLSGGYSGNQVSTVLGFGFFLLSTRLFIPYKNVLVQGVMMFFMVLMGYRALLTFSRGGVFVGIIIAIVFIIVYHLKNRGSDKLITGLRIFGILIAAVLLWGFTQAQTSGMIENRYANRDALGREKEDYTTGRGRLMAVEIKSFLENPVLGIGAGRVRMEFEEELGIRSATHNEISRTLSEHGSLGIFALLTLIFAPLMTMLRGRQNIYFWPFLLFWLLTISHSAMRMALPAFVYALCLLDVSYEPDKKNIIRRKQARKTRALPNLGRQHST